MKIKQIDFYVNEDHRKSGLPPIVIDKGIDANPENNFSDLQKARIFVDNKILPNIKALYSLPDMVATMHIV